VLRWVWTFDAWDGGEALRQLQNVKPGGGAILAVPRGKRTYEVIRDLSRKPARGKIEDLKDMKSVFFVEEGPEVLAALARALGIEPPPYLVVFFPPELEEEVARLEREQAGGRDIADIEETTVTLVPSSKHAAFGRSPRRIRLAFPTYRPVIVSIKPKKP
jgi:hypothetical protein